MPSVLATTGRSLVLSLWVGIAVMSVAVALLIAAQLLDWQRPRRARLRRFVGCAAVADLVVFATLVALRVVIIA